MKKLIIRLVKIVGIADVLKLLEQYNINTEMWGTKAGSRSAESLFDEIQAGKSYLCTEGDQLFRCTSVSMIYPFYRDTDGHWRRLVLLGRHMPDGKMKNYSHRIGVSKKIRPGLEADEVAMQAMEERLNIPRTPTLELHLISTDDERHWNSRSFPGLPVHQSHSCFVCLLHKKQVKKEGYVYTHPQSKVISHYGWQVVPITMVPPIIKD